MERLRRTMLFVPGGDEKVLAKGLGLDMDSSILDLEDSVALEKKFLWLKLSLCLLAGSSE